MVSRASSAFTDLNNNINGGFSKSEDSYNLKYLKYNIDTDNETKSENIDISSYFLPYGENNLKGGYSESNLEKKASYFGSFFNYFGISINKKN